MKRLLVLLLIACFVFASVSVVMAAGVDFMATDTRCLRNGNQAGSEEVSLKLTRESLITIPVTGTSGKTISSVKLVLTNADPNHWANFDVLNLGSAYNPATVTWSDLYDYDGGERTIDWDNTTVYGHYDMNSNKPIDYVMTVNLDKSILSGDKTYWLVLRCTQESNDDANFVSTASDDTAKHPKLVITYADGSNPPTGDAGSAMMVFAAIASLGGLVILRRRKI
jgi:LPXTG-motif cell wall-anchored protein